MWEGGQRGKGWEMGEGGGRQGVRVNEGNGKVERGWLGLMGTVGMGNGFWDGWDAFLDGFFFSD